MRKLCLPLLLCLIKSGLAAQSLSPAAQSLMQDVHQLKIRDWESYKETVNGSPYYFDDFKEATLLSKGTEVHNGELVRYNIFNDQMELKKAGNVYAFTKDTSLYYRIKLDDITFEVIPIKFKSSPFSYAELIAEGKYKLYAIHQVSFVPAAEPKGYQDAKPPEYNRQVPKYYFKYESGDFIKVKNFKQIAEQIPEKTSELEKYIKKEKLKFKKKEDQKALIDYLNQ